MPDVLNQQDDALLGVPDWLKRLVGGAKGPAPTPAATPPVTLGGGTPAVKSAEMSTTPIKAPPVSFASQAAQMAGQEPTRDQFPVQNMPPWKKLLGGALSAVASIRDPNAPKEFFDSPKQKAEADYNQKHQEWVGKMAQIANQANLARTDSEIGEKAAQTDEAAARAEALRNPPEKAQKPGTPEEQAFQAYIQKGMDPTAAFRQVQQDKQDVKPDKQPNEKEQDIKDHLAAKGWADTPANRDRARADIAARAPAASFAIQNSTPVTDAAVDQAADRYFYTGQLPPIGRGGAGMAQIAKIRNRAAEKYAGQSIVEGSAEYAANKDALKKLQTQTDQMNAFENTATKNLDLFEKQAKPIIDKGSPLINQPLRTIDQKVLGKPEMAAFSAARQTALTEVAKVLSSATGSGVLSDSARKEVSDLIGPDATLAQIHQAVQILKQDMQNRHTSYNDQIKEIKGRMRDGGQGSTEKSGGTWNAKTGRYE